MTDEPLSFDLYHPEPLLVVISGPSGVGKDAVVKALQQRNFPMHFVVTMTSRKPRDNEVDGVDYWFVTREKFEEMIRQDQFLEYANVYQDYKGIPRAQVAKALESKKDVVLRLDVQGAKTIRKLFPESLLIFLIPSDKDEWLARLGNRGSETAESLAIRLETARHELKQIHEFDYIVVNAQGQLEKTVDTLVSILVAEHHRVNPRKVNL
mgnify:CR=1 FL=1